MPPILTTDRGRELAAQHARYTAVHHRLMHAQTPSPKPARPRPVSPFVREIRERRKAQREAFEFQMANTRAGIAEVPLDRSLEFGWPRYLPPVPYDHCIPPGARGPAKTMREIIAEVARKHGITMLEMRSMRRARAIVIARQEAMYRCKAETSCSLPQIGRALGGKDHTTVLHGIKKHEQRLREATTP